MAAPGDPVMIVVGGGAIALGTTQELCALHGHRVVVLWRRDPDFSRAVENIGAVHIAVARPDSAEALDRAGVRHAVTILALSPDDQLNLHAALLARDANPCIRIVLRQFNRTLAHKIETESPELLGPVVGLAFGRDLCRRGGRPLMLPRVAIPRARWPADRLCDANSRKLWRRR